MPFFTVVIPTFNRAHFLPQVVASVLAQHFTDFELLVVDDGSTDDTPDVLDQLAAQDSRVTYIRKRNEERSIARNTGFLLAQGQYVVFHDSDDLMRPEHLASLAEKIDQHPEAKFLATKFAILRDRHEQPSDLAPLPEGYYDYRFFLQGNPLAAFVCVKKDNAQWQPFPPEFNMCEDWIFHLLNYRHTPLYLIDATTIVLLDHPQRSMAHNQRVIAGRLKAAQFVQAKMQLNAREQRMLMGHSYRFCAVHAYLDGHRWQALGYWWRSLWQLGPSVAALLLFLKICVGKKIINTIKKYFSKSV